MDDQQRPVIPFTKRQLIKGTAAAVAVTAITPAAVFLGPSGRGDCGIVAIAAASGISYDKVFRFIKHKGNYDNDWTGATRFGDRILACWYLGISFEQCFVPVNFQCDTIPDCPVSVTDFCRNWCQPNEAYILQSKANRHVVAVKNGMAIDNGEREFVLGVQFPRGHMMVSHMIRVHLH